MELVYLLQGLNYPCTIEWYYGEIDIENYIGRKKYTFSGIDDVINNFETIHIAKEFNRISSTHYKIAIV